MKNVPFFKMSGSGNDFVFLDGRLAGPLAAWSPERIARICHRRTGVGADGLVILEPQPGRGGRAAVRFNYFNADGGRSDMCGNASLCATRLAEHLGLAETEMTLVTDVGDFETRTLPGPGERAEIDLGDIPAPIRPSIEPVGGEREILQYLVGIPHVVVLVDDVDAPAADPMVRGRFIRSHPGTGRAGANANFVSQMPDGSWRYRTFERGVEAETLACGTGAVAVAAGLRFLDATNMNPTHLQTSSGKVLEIAGESTPHGGLAQCRLAGEGRLVFRGEFSD